MANDHVERVLTAMSDLCEPLHDAFTTARTLTRERNPELAGHADYRWFETHSIRAYARQGLRETDLGLWSLAGSHARNGELWLFAEGYRTRVLHTSSDSEVPPTGSNWERRAFYRNVPLFAVDHDLFGPVDDKLLILWRMLEPAGVPAFRVVRTLYPVKKGERAQLDLDFPLPPTAVDLRDLRFEPSDSDIDLFAALDEDLDEGGAEDAGGIGG